MTICGSHGFTRASVDLVREFGGKVVGQDAGFFEIYLHALKAQFEGSLNVIDNDIVRDIAHQFRGIQFIVGTIGLEDFGLFLEGKVGIFKGRVNVLFEKIQDFIVGNNSGIGKVVNARQSLVRHGQGRGQHFVENRHGIGNVDNLFVLGNLGHKVAVRKVVTDGHAHTENQTGGIGFEHGFHETFGFAVK